MEAGEAEAVAWTAQASPSASGEVAEHEEVMYCQKASLVHSPWHLMLIWSRPCRYAAVAPPLRRLCREKRPA